MGIQQKIRRKTVGAAVLAMVSRAERAGVRARQRAVGLPTRHEQELYNEQARRRAAQPFA